VRSEAKRGHNSVIYTYMIMASMAAIALPVTAAKAFEVGTTHAANDNTINLWNLSNNRLSRSFMEHSTNVISLAVSPDSRVLVSGALDGIRMWDLLQQLQN
jgi:WD40 repeat protein